MDVLGFCVESEFDVSDERKFVIFLTIILGVTGGSAGSFLEFGVHLLDETLEFLFDGGLSADTIFNLVKRDGISIGFKSRFSEDRDFDVSNQWNVNVFHSLFDGVSLGGASTFSEVLVNFLDVLLVFLSKLDLSALESFNLPEINEAVS